MSDGSESCSAGAGTAGGSHLITTALEETWPDDGPVVFLGEWCRRYSRREQWRSLDGIVAPYHWSEPAQRDRDYALIESLCDSIMVDLAQTMNTVHGVDRSTRYWRVVLGPWLCHFVSVVVARWGAIYKVLEFVPIGTTRLLSIPKESMAPRNMFEFDEWETTDWWNHQIYGAVLEAFSGIEIERIPVSYQTGDPSDSGLTDGTAVGTQDQSLPARLVAEASRRLAGRISRTGAFPIDTYLPYESELALHLRCGQLPLLWGMIDRTQVDAPALPRNWTVSGNAIDPCDAFVRSLIPTMIPAAYVEGYVETPLVMKQRLLPEAVDVVFTSGGHYYDDVLKFWMAEQVEKGAGLAIGQHGGGYGLSKWYLLEKHDRAIADRYLSWGWSDPDDCRVRPIGHFRSYQRWLRTRNQAEAREALLVQNVTPRHSYVAFSSVVSSQWLDYFEDQRSFIDGLSAEVRDDLLVRLFPEDYGWDQEARFIDEYPDVNFDSGTTLFVDLLRTAKACIVTYNATLFLTTFAEEIPTVMMWRPEHWDLRESAEPVFDHLREAGILYDDPVEAAAHLSAIWSDVDGWWQSEKVVRARGLVNERINWPHRGVAGRISRELKELRSEARCSSEG